MDPCREILLRPASADDGEFIMQVYASTRKEEMAGWGWSMNQQASFVRMQFEARQRGYAATYPSAEHSVVSVGGASAGYMIISRGGDEIRLVDIALLPEFRRRGIGGALIGRLISEAARTTTAVRLSALRVSRAAHLYARLGFIEKGGDGMYCEMEWAVKQESEKMASRSVENDSHAGQTE